MLFVNFHKDKRKKLHQIQELFPGLDIKECSDEELQIKKFPQYALKISHEQPKQHKHFSKDPWTDLFNYMLNKLKTKKADKASSNTTLQQSSIIQSQQIPADVKVYVVKIAFCEKKWSETHFFFTQMSSYLKDLSCEKPESYTIEKSLFGVHCCFLRTMGFSQTSRDILLKLNLHPVFVTTIEGWKEKCTRPLGEFYEEKRQFDYEYENYAKTEQYKIDQIALLEGIDGLNKCNEKHEHSGRIQSLTIAGLSTIDTINDGTMEVVEKRGKECFRKVQRG